MRLRRASRRARFALIRGSPLSTFTVETAGALPGPPWLRDRRRASFERFAAMPLPSPDQEDWRYSRIADLDLGLYSVLPADAPAPTGVPAALEPVLAAVGERAGLLLLVNGRIARAELDDELARQGVVLAGLADETVAAAGALQPSAVDGLGAFAHLNGAFAADIASLRVPAGVVVDKPVVVLQWIDADKAAVFPRLVVEAAPQSQVTVVDHSSSDNVAAFVDPVVELRAEDAANIAYYSVQDLGRRVWQTGHLVTTSGRDATVQAWLAALGGEYARLHLDAELPGQGSTSETVGVYFGDGEQVHDFRSLQHHDAPRASSSFLLKGAVVDQARGVYTGLIRIEAGAKGTDAFLTNRNLVLSEGSRVDSVPNLEIVNENDLRNCGHASATGPVEEEHLFYLESRGVPTDVARRLVVLGFFAEVLDRVPIPGLREVLSRAVGAKLRRMETSG